MAALLLCFMKYIMCALDCDFYCLSVNKTKSTGLVGHGFPPGIQKSFGVFFHSQPDIT